MKNSIKYSFLLSLAILLSVNIFAKPNKAEKAGWLLGIQTYTFYSVSLLEIPDDQENVLKPGEWNTMRIKVIGSEVTTWLNNVEMTHLNDSLIGRADGRIALQIHNGGGIKVQWKNFRIKEL